MLSIRTLVILLIILIVIGILGFFQVGPFNPENHPDQAFSELHSVSVWGDSIKP